MGTITKKCKKCKGTGLFPPFKMDSKTVCSECEGSGIQLHSFIEDKFNEATIADGTRLYPGDVGYIEFEEEDYQI